MKHCVCVDCLLVEWVALSMTCVVSFDQQSLCAARKVWLWLLFHQKWLL